MSYDVSIFADSDSFHDFLLESVKQYSQLKFGNKSGLLSALSEMIAFDLDSSHTYEEILDTIEESNEDVFEDLFNKQSRIEVAESYQFYKFLSNGLNFGKNDESLEKFCSYVENGEGIDKNGTRECAREIIISNSMEELENTWAEFSTDINYLEAKPVSIFNHLSIGPLGLIFSHNYEPGVRFFFNYKTGFWSRRVPLLEKFLLPSVYESEFRGGSYPFELEKSDLVRVFSSLIDLVEESIKSNGEYPPTYEQYLQSKTKDIQKVLQKYKDDLPKECNKFENQIQGNNSITDLFGVLSQACLLFVPNEDLVECLNDLIISGDLLVTERSQFSDSHQGVAYKITEDGIIDNSRNNAVFDLAEDVVSIRSEEVTDSDVNSEFIKIANRGLLKYLDDLQDKNFDIYESIFHENNLNFKERHRVVSDRSKVVLLEHYGISLHLRPSFMVRDDISEYLTELSKFKNSYDTLGNRELTSEVIDLLRDARSYVERFLKEFFVLESSLYIYFKRNNNEDGEDNLDEIFSVASPIFEQKQSRRYLPSSGRVTYWNMTESFEDYLNSLSSYLPKNLQTKVKKFQNGSNPGFTLGDWHQLINATEKHALTEDFWKSLPSSFEERTKDLSRKVDIFMGSDISILNTASHEGAKTELRTDNQKRSQALRLVLDLERQLTDFYEYIPGPAQIINETEDVESGITSYRISFASIGNRNERRKIYGTEISSIDSTYFVIPTAEEDDNLIYPILIRNFVDDLF